MSIFRGLTFVNDSMIKLGGFITGVMAALTLSVSPYFSSVYLAPIMLLRFPMLINNLTAYMLSILSFFPAAYIAAIAPNLTPIMVATITIAVPLSLSVILLLPFTYKIGTIPGEAFVIGIEPVIEGLFKGVRAFFNHILTRVSEILKEEPKKQSDTSSVTNHGSNGSDNDPGKGGDCPAKGFNWVYDMFRSERTQHLQYVTPHQDIRPSAPPLNPSHNLPADMALLGVRVVEATIVPTTEAQQEHNSGYTSSVRL